MYTLTCVVLRDHVCVSVYLSVCVEEMLGKVESHKKAQKEVEKSRQEVCVCMCVLMFW